VRRARARLLAATACAALTGACNALVGIPGSEVDGVDAGKDAPDLVLVFPDAGKKDVATDAEKDGAALPGTAALSVSSGFGFGSWCAITLDGVVKCWGNNFYGDLGDGTTTSSAAPVTVTGLPAPATQVSVGAGTACALVSGGDASSGGAVWCWGDGEVGELGNGSTTQIQKTPVPVTNLTADVAQISAGFFSACAVKQDGSVWCWGTLGEGDPVGVTSSSITAVPVVGVTGASSVAVGLDTVCAIVTGGAVMCWGGYGGPDMLGNGTTGGSMAPVAVTGLTGVTSLTGGATFACAVTGTGGVECWGYGGQGQLGQGDTQLSTSPLPVDVMELTSGVEAVAAGPESVCALKVDGTVWCWGVADDDQLGNGLAPDLDVHGEMGYLRGVPVQVAGLPGPAKVLSGGNAPCVVTEKGGIACWGLTAAVATTPVPVALPSNGVITTSAIDAVSVTIGGDESNGFACAVTSQGLTACWGRNDFGELGDGAMTSTLAPVETGSVLLTNGTTAVSASPDEPFACAVARGQVQCWGIDVSGELGDGQQASSVDDAVAVSLPAGIGFTSVSAGGLGACALSAAGAVYCWGDNSYGEIGDGTVGTGGGPVKTPVALPTLTSGVTAVSVGLDYACALLSGGTVDCWGDNSLGQLGTSSPSANPTPTPVPGITGANSLSAGWFSTCVTTTAGNIYCWGYGGDCELGNNTCQSSTSPVEVQMDPGFVSGATKVAVGYNSACAIVNGGAWCWGSNALGNATLSTLYTAPYAVAVTGLGKDVTDIAVGHTSACAVAGGALSCWGTNTGGQLGNGGVGNELTATPVPGFP